MEIVSGLSCSSVNRLKKTWQLIHSKYMTRLNQMRSIVNSKNNFGMLRAAVQNANPPVIPYLGVFFNGFNIY